MSWAGKTRLEIERELLQAVEQARARYEDLDREHLRMLDLVREIGLGNQDGTIMLARSLEQHRAVQAAIEDYRTAPEAIPSGSGGSEVAGGLSHNR